MMGKLVIYCAVGIVLLSLLVGFSGTLRHIRLGRVWYYMTTKSNDEVIQILEADSDSLGHELTPYYLAHAYMYRDLDTSLELAQKYLLSLQRLPAVQLNARAKFFAHLLLAQLYFYKHQFQESAVQYWQALQARPHNDVIRYNYELALFFSTVYKDEPAGATDEETLEFDSNENPQDITPPPVSLEKILTNTQYYFYIDEGTTSTDKNW